MTSNQKLFGLLARRECWSLTWRGRLVVLLVAALAAWAFLVGVHPFLAVTRRADARILVMEGWVPDEAVRASINEFNTGHYDRIYTTGGPPEGRFPQNTGGATIAIWGAVRLTRAGLDPNKVESVPAGAVFRDRTYSSALALRDWFRDHHLPVPAVNVVTEDAHARRTRLLFEKALGPDVKVGVISAKNPEYDPRRWWRYSEGVREIISETVAYLYAKFLFWPGDRDQKPEVNGQP